MERDSKAHVAITRSERVLILSRVPAAEGKANMRILIVSHYFPPEPMRIGDLARGLKELGNEVQVLTGLPSYPYGTIYPGYEMRLFQRQDYHGVDVIRVPIYPNHSKSNFRRALNYLSFAISGSVLGPALVNTPDRILVYQNSPATMAIPAFVIKAVRGGRLFLWVQVLHSFDLPRPRGDVR